MPAAPKISPVRQRTRPARAWPNTLTAEVTPHHLLLCDEDIPGPDPDYKMNPPLRTRRDRAGHHAVHHDPGKPEPEKARILA